MEYDLIALECYFPVDIKMPEGIVEIKLNFRVWREEISALTEPIVIERFGEYAHLGPFWIYIPLRSSSLRARIKIFPLDRDGREYSHPHISGDGYPCWGNRNHGLMKEIIAAKDWEALLSMCIEFLKSYNPSGAYYHLFDERYCTLCDEPTSAEDCTLCPVCGIGFCTSCEQVVRVGRNLFKEVCCPCAENEEHECPECGYFVIQGRFCACGHYVHDDCWEDHRENCEDK